MTLGAPLGLLALLALAPVVAAYFLRRKQPPRVVSALFLWRSPDQRAEAGPRLERFSREASLALESFVVLCAALFLADARCGAERPGSHVVVVLDGSLSMRAVSGGSTAADRARDEVARVARDEGATALTIVETGLKPRVLAGPQQDVARAMSALEDWIPSQPSHDVTPALTLARELASGASQRIFFVTDGPPGAATLPAGVQGISVGRRLPNVGFLSAQRRDENGVATVTVRVVSYADQAQTVRLRLEAGKALAREDSLRLEPGEATVVRATLRTELPIKASLPEDALVADGVLHLPPSPVEPVRAGLLEGLDAASQAAVTRALSVIEGVSLDGPAAWTVGPTGSRASVRLGATGQLQSFIGPFFAQKTSPLLDDVQLSGVVWTAGAEAPPGTPLLTAGPFVLASETDEGVVHLNLEVSRSNVQRSVAWPVLWGNLVRSARSRREGFPRRLLQLGDEVPVVIGAGRRWRLEGPAGEPRPVLGAGAMTLPPVPFPGTWRLLADGEEVDRLEVLALDAAESDLRTRGPWTLEAPRTSAMAALASSQPRGWGFVAAALALLLVDFWLTARRRA